MNVYYIYRNGEIIGVPFNSKQHAIHYLNTLYVRYKRVFPQTQKISNSEFLVPELDVNLNIGIVSN